MARLAQIFEDVEALDIKIGGVTVPVLGLDVKRSRVNDQLPIRIMVWSSNNEGGGNDYHYTDIRGNSYAVDWTVVDLMLLSPTAQTEGFFLHDPKLVEFADNYTEALRIFCGSFELRAWKLVTAGFFPGNYEWPLESNMWYIGLRVELDVTEVE